MVEIVGCVAMSHGPQLFTPPGKWSQLPTRIKGPFHPKAGIAAELTAAAMSANSERCHAAIGVLGKKIESWNPDTIVVVGDDQAENILPDNTPPFTIYIAPEADATTKYSYFGTDTSKQITRYPSDSE